MPEMNPARDNESEAADWIASILGGYPRRRDISPEQGKHGDLCRKVAGGGKTADQAGF